MHKIENHILSTLVHRAKARYRDIKPPTVEGNHFMYYLKKLISKDLVAKTNDHYHLTPTGKAFADKLSLKSFQPRIQPKIVSLIIVFNEEGQQLLYQRQKQPFIDLIGFPYGKIHLGESILTAANRELKEKTGIKADLNHVGDAYITVYEQDELVSQMLAHVFVGHHSTGKPKNSFWGNLSDYPAKEVLPVNQDLLKLATSNNHFFIEKTIKNL